MKTNKRSLILSIALFAIASSYCIINANSKPAKIVKSNKSVQDSTIIGSWILEDDNNSKFIFTADSLYSQYYENNLIDKGTFRIRNSSPQCGVEVSVNANTNYLQLLSINLNSTFCYEIYGIGLNKLTIRILDRGEILIFTKQ